VLAADERARRSRLPARARGHGDALGLYRGSWLQVRDAFGVGRHPDDGEEFQIRDISFRYEIAEEAAASRR
jgi:hypothetical protein